MLLMNSAGGWNDCNADLAGGSDCRGGGARRVRAVLALEPFAGLAPYAGVIYGLIVFVVLICVQVLYSGPLPELRLR